MGYQNEHANRLVFDLETAPLPDAADYLEPESAPSNYKDPVKIAEFIATKQAENLSRCSLDPDLCRVVAIGWQWEPLDGASELVASTVGMPEELMLRAFWSQAEGAGLLVGFNCLGFDLPVLLRRSLYLGVRAPQIQIDRFKHPRVVDLMDELSYSGKLKLRGLDFYCRRFGIQVDGDTLTGADIPAAVAVGNWPAVEAHVRADVQKTAALAAKLGHFTLHPQPAAVL